MSGREYDFNDLYYALKEYAEKAQEKNRPPPVRTREQAIGDALGILLSFWLGGVPKPKCRCCNCQ